MNFSKYLTKFLAILISVITPFTNLLVARSPIDLLDKQTTVVEKKADGFIKGICHPDYEDCDLIKDANIGWIRFDMPLPYEKDGSISQSYLYWKAESKAYADRGFKIMAITPYPDEYIEYGLDPRDENCIEGIQDIARFFVKDLKGIVGAFQITNEMGIDRFTYPLTLDEAAKFIGIQLEAMQPVKGNILVGYNLAGNTAVIFPFKMIQWNKYCDYVGIDIYLGCFENFIKNPDLFLTIIGYVRRITNKPIILCEFGYIGLGEPKTDEEKTAILQSYGYNSEKEARENIDDFISKLPPDLANEFDKYADKTPKERADLMFDGEYSNHLYRELPDGFGLNGFKHTPEGQADFYEYIIPKIRSLNYVVGAFVYCWHDSDDCYVCGQADCPVETKWGLVDANGNPKPAYYTVQKAFAD